MFLAYAKILFLFLQSAVVARIATTFFHFSNIWQAFSSTEPYAYGSSWIEGNNFYGKVRKLGYCLPEICENLHFLAFIWLSLVLMSLSNTALYFTNSYLNTFHSTGSHSLPLHPAVASLGYMLSRQCYCTLIFQYKKPCCFAILKI